MTAAQRQLVDDFLFIENAQERLDTFLDGLRHTSTRLAAVHRYLMPEVDEATFAAFLRAAHRGLLPGGTLWLVANRHLPYDRILTPLFRTVEEIGGDAVFRLFRAAHPIRAR